MTKPLACTSASSREDDTDAEAHWCCALCRFGIDYVEAPATYEWLPTCHRASFDSFLEDVDYLTALEHSDGITRRQYQKDAAKIAEVQRGIRATSQNTEPYDVFISYKELDANGERTRDSVLAQDIYYQLSEQGRRVFFSRVSLEDELRCCIDERQRAVAENQSEDISRLCRKTSLVLAERNRLCKLNKA